jgi:hypothetical protein
VKGGCETIEKNEAVEIFSNDTFINKIRHKTVFSFQFLVADQDNPTKN